MSEIVIQCAAGADYEKLLDLTRPMHLALFGAKLRQYRRPLDASPYQPKRIPLWDKIHFIRKHLNEAADGDIVLFMDCDVVALQAPDFEKALLGADFAAVENRWGAMNLGVMFWRANAATRSIIDLIDRQGPPHPNDWEHDVVNEYIRSLFFRKLPKNYNFYRNSMMVEDPSHPIYIKAWHGQGCAVALQEIERELDAI